MAPRTLVIGRSTFADIVVTDASVAPYHAELVIAADGRLHLTDAGTTEGTCLETPSGWQRVRQAFVRPSDRIRLGDYACTPEELLRAVGGDRSEPSQAVGRPPAPTRATSRGRLERDAVTGEIVRRRG
jgi:pSer/pThr/pTyr-binding forkhead associated (FHA) protein